MNFVDYHKSADADLAVRAATFLTDVATAEAAGRLGQPNSPLCLLADGDSWFDYPLNGLIPGLSTTDIIAQLPDCCHNKPLIHNLAQHGDGTTAALGLARIQSMIAAIKAAPKAGQFDAILFSAGGNDVVGDPFYIWLQEAARVGGDPTQALDPVRFGAVLHLVEAAYLDLLAFRDEYLPGAPIFTHAYDFAFPDGRGVCTVGPWLKPSLDFCGWTDPAVAKQIVRDALTQLANILKKLAAVPANKLVVVPTQGTLTQHSEWDNELHPKPPGFKLMAAKFQAALAAYPGFAGRI